MMKNKFNFKYFLNLSSNSYYITIIKNKYKIFILQFKVMNNLFASFNFSFLSIKIFTFYYSKIYLLFFYFISFHIKFIDYFNINFFYREDPHEEKYAIYNTPFVTSYWPFKSNYWYIFKPWVLPGLSFTTFGNVKETYEYTLYKTFNYTITSYRYTADFGKPDPAKGTKQFWIGKPLISYWLLQEDYGYFYDCNPVVHKNYYQNFYFGQCENFYEDKNFYIDNDDVFEIDVNNTKIKNKIFTDIENVDEYEEMYDEEFNAEYEELLKKEELDVEEEKLEELEEMVDEIYEYESPQFMDENDFFLKKKIIFKNYLFEKNYNYFFQKDNYNFFQKDNFFAKFYVIFFFFFFLFFFKIFEILIKIFIFIPFICVDIIVFFFHFFFIPARYIYTILMNFAYFFAICLAIAGLFYVEKNYYVKNDYIYSFILSLRKISPKDDFAFLAPFAPYIVIAYFTIGYLLPLFYQHSYMKNYIVKHIVFSPFLENKNKNYFKFLKFYYFFKSNEKFANSGYIQKIIFYFMIVFAYIKVQFNKATNNFNMLGFIFIIKFKIIFFLALDWCLYFFHFLLVYFFSFVAYAKLKFIYFIYFFKFWFNKIIFFSVNYLFFSFKKFSFLFFICLLICLPFTKFITFFSFAQTYKFFYFIFFIFIIYWWFFIVFFTDIFLKFYAFIWMPGDDDYLTNTNKNPIILKSILSKAPWYEFLDSEESDDDTGDEEGDDDIELTEIDPINYIDFFFILWFLIFFCKTIDPQYFFYFQEYMDKRQLGSFSKKRKLSLLKILQNVVDVAEYQKQIYGSASDEVYKKTILINKKTDSYFSLNQFYYFFNKFYYYSLKKLFTVYYSHFPLFFDFLTYYSEFNIFNNNFFKEKIIIKNIDNAYSYKHKIFSSFSDERWAKQFFKNTRQIKKGKPMKIFYAKLNQKTRYFKDFNKIINNYQSHFVFNNVHNFKYDKFFNFYFNYKKINFILTFFFEPYCSNNINNFKWSNSENNDFDYYTKAIKKRKKKISIGSNDFFKSSDFLRLVTNFFTKNEFKTLAWLNYFYFRNESLSTTTKKDIKQDIKNLENFMSIRVYKRLVHVRAYKRWGVEEEYDTTQENTVFKFASSDFYKIRQKKFFSWDTYIKSRYFYPRVTKTNYKKFYPIRNYNLDYYFMNLFKQNHYFKISLKEAAIMKTRESRKPENNSMITYKYDPTIEGFYREDEIKKIKKLYVPVNKMAYQDINIMSHSVIRRFKKKRIFNKKFFYVDFFKDFEKNINFDKKVNNQVVGISNSFQRLSDRARKKVLRKMKVLMQDWAPPKKLRKKKINKL